jgi:Ca2+-binding RTX toxin-like protein
MTTTVYVNKDGLDFTASPAIIYEDSYSRTTSSGYAYYPEFTEQWTGTNLGYSTQNVVPISGTLTSIIVTKPNRDVIYSIECNYQIKATDASFTLDTLTMAIIMSNPKEIVQWYGGSNDDKFYLFSGSNIDGGKGTDSLQTYNAFPSYSFSNFDVSTSSMTITNVAQNASANLKSIENVVFTDKTLSFLEIAALFNKPAPVVNHSPTGDITISGSPTQGQVLTLANSIADADGLGTMSYQWARNNLPISGANQINYLLTAADVGRAISVTASYADGLKTAENVTSSETDLVDTVTPTYILTASKSRIDEGMTITFNLATTNLSKNSQVNFKFSGDITNDDIAGGLPESSFVIGANGKASLSLKLVNDKKIEGNETLVLTLNDDDSQMVKVVVTDTSAAPKISTIPSSGNDVLTGTSKADTLIGGLGIDTLTGGNGADIFKFNDVKESRIDAQTRDTITDFKSADSDKIDLSGIDANIKLAGNQVFIFIGSTAFSKVDATGQLRFDTVTHTLYGSTNTDIKPEFSIQLNGVSSLVATDFVL